MGQVCGRTAGSRRWVRFVGENSRRSPLGQVCGRTAGGHFWVRFVGEQQEVTVGSGLWENNRRSLLGQVCGRTTGGHCWVRFVGEQQEVTVGSGLQAALFFGCRPDHFLQHTLSSTSFIRTNIYIVIIFLH